MLRTLAVVALAIFGAITLFFGGIALMAAYYEICSMLVPMALFTAGFGLIALSAVTALKGIDAAWRRTGQGRPLPARWLLFGYEAWLLWFKFHHPVIGRQVDETLRPMLEKKGDAKRLPPAQ